MFAYIFVKYCFIETKILLTPRTIAKSGLIKVKSKENGCKYSLFCVVIQIILHCIIICLTRLFGLKPAIKAFFQNEEKEEYQDWKARRKITQIVQTTVKIIRIKIAECHDTAQAMSQMRWKPIILEILSVISALCRLFFVLLQSVTNTANFQYTKYKLWTY